MVETRGSSALIVSHIPASGTIVPVRQGLERNDVLNLQLRAELHHLLGRHAEECRGAFGVALEEGEQAFAPDPHARNVLARDDGLAADVIGDAGEVDAGKLALAAG